jgi:cyclohexa-1,5-dienecarbonyl-CoA hydratase
VSAPVRIERGGERVARVVLDRPPLQILDLELLARLDEALAGLAGEPALQLVRLESTGGRAFSAGVSIHDHTPEKVERMLLSFHGALGRLRALDALTVALIDGHCLGGGMELALCCDLVFATERSKLGQPEIALGCFPPVAAALYPRRIGTGRTLELLLTGRTFPAAEGIALGLVDETFPDAAALEARAAQLAEAVTRQSAAATRLAKRAVRAGEEQPFAPALAEAERLYLERLTRTADMAEGIAAFLEKRPADWKHR